MIHGSKDLVLKLSKLRLPVPPFGDKYYLVTGDVVAFYPNIPLEPCIDIVYNMWLEHTFDAMEFNATDEENGVYLGYLGGQHRLLAQIFKRALLVSSTKLVCQFQGQHSLQKRGLAMGVPESPDLANLYGYHFEKKCDVLNDPKIAFYGRYIDDCFAIVSAASSEAARQYMANKIQYDGCQILWEVSAQRCNFLDATFYFGLDGSLQWKAYRKPNNHMERIPWISGHPLDVKRGTFIGEMSRLATLSSLFPSYLDSVRELVALYVKRGYPQDLVANWVKKHLKERWEKRLSEKDETRTESDVLVLKSQYNTAWNYFNAKELGDTILGYWRDWHERADRGHNTLYTNIDWPRPTRIWEGIKDVDSALQTEVSDTVGGTILIPDMRKIGILNRRVIVSRKRGRNMFDLTNLWKKIVLEKLDEKVSEEEISTPLAQPTATAGPSGSYDIRSYFVDHRENMHRRSPSPNKPQF